MNANNDNINFRIGDDTPVELVRISVDGTVTADHLIALLDAADALAEAVWPHQQEMQSPNGTPTIRDALKTYREARRSCV
jgi:hypothetical protein